MPEKHGPDGGGVHQDYKIEAERVARQKWGRDCADVVAIKVHDLELAKKVVEFLQSEGFSVSLERHTKTIMDEDEFPEEEGE